MCMYYIYCSKYPRVYVIVGPELQWNLNWLSYYCFFFPVCCYKQVNELCKKKKKGGKMCVAVQNHGNSKLDFGKYYKQIDLIESRL